MEYLGLPRPIDLHKQTDCRGSESVSEETVLICVLEQQLNPDGCLWRTSSYQRFLQSLGFVIANAVITDVYLK